jgi:hypothetical protein
LIALGNLKKIYKEIKHLKRLVTTSHIFWHEIIKTQNKKKKHKNKKQCNLLTIHSTKQLQIHFGSQMTVLSILHSAMIKNTSDKKAMLDFPRFANVYCTATKQQCIMDSQRKKKLN